MDLDFDFCRLGPFEAMLEDLMRKRITHFDNVAFYSPEEELYVTKMWNS